MKINNDPICLMQNMCRCIQILKKEIRTLKELHKNKSINTEHYKKLNNIANITLNECELLNIALCECVFENKDIRQVNYGRYNCSLLSVVKDTLESLEKCRLFKKS